MEFAGLQLPPCSIPSTPSYERTFGYLRSKPAGLNEPWKSTNNLCLAASLATRVVVYHPLIATIHEVYLHSSYSPVGKCLEQVKMIFYRQPS